MDIRHPDDDQIKNVSTRSSQTSSVPTNCYVKVHMFSNAQNLLIRDTAIHNAGRDITIINNYTYAEPELVSARFPCGCVSNLGMT
jgi:hypothetical protein